LFNGKTVGVNFIIAPQSEATYEAMVVMSQTPGTTLHKIFGSKPPEFTFAAWQKFVSAEVKSAVELEVDADTVYELAKNQHKCGAAYQAMCILAASPGTLLNKLYPQNFTQANWIKFLDERG
jgi:hypothetical protein